MIVGLESMDLDLESFPGGSLLPISVITSVARPMVPSGFCLFLKTKPDIQRLKSYQHKDTLIKVTQIQNVIPKESVEGFEECLPHYNEYS